MSLQVWLPLNGSLENKGLSNAGITSSGITYVSGKIGNAANFSSSYIGIDNTPITGNITDFSFAFWMKTSSPSNSMCLYNGRTTVGGACSIFTIGGKFRFDDGALNTLDYTIPSNTWEHYCFTRDASYIKLYVNGVLKVTAPSTSFTCGATKATIGQSSTNTTTGNGLNTFVGQLNDFRIYNHCLSPLEVKQISQGLVCHYKLSGVGNENLVKGCYECYLTNTTQNVSGNLIFTLSSDEMIKLKGKTLVFSYYYSAEGERLVAEGGLGNRFGIHGTFNYTDTNGSTIQRYPFASYLEDSGTGRAIMKWTIPSDIDTINSNLGFAKQIYAKPNTDNDSTWYIKDCKLEIGSDATPWCPAPSDTLYSTLGYNNPIEYDCSGYENNGTKVGDITWSGDSARYSGSYYFGTETATCVNTPNFDFENMSQGTVSMWINRHSTNSNWRNYLMFANSYNWTSSENDFIIFGSTGDSTIWMDCCSNLYGFSPDLNKWYLYTLSWDLTTHIAKMYVNGELKATKTNSKIDTTYASKHNMHFIGNKLYSESDYSLSDFRLYSTCLSDEDVKSLYNVSASIDKTGVLSAYEFSESEEV